MPRTKIVILVLFFLSGACTLVYEVVWVRMLILVFGTSAFALSTVLSAFMAGLALGSVYFGRLVDRKGNGLRIYALLELAIGAFALAFPFILSGLDDFYTFLYQHLQGMNYLFSLIRFLLSFAILLVPTTLMGATLPVLSKYVVRHLGQLGWNVGGLYAINTFGATAGCFAAAFVLIEHLGVSGTVYLSAGVNLLIAGIAFHASRHRAAPAPRPARAAGEEEGPSRPAPPRYVIRLVFAGFALSGFTALGYEVLWTRLLSMFLQSATAQSLSTILIAFLFGLAGGGALGARYADRWKDLLSVFGLIELLIGLFGLGSIAIFGSIPYILQALAPFSSWQGHLFRLFVAAFSIMLVPTFLMGLLFPIVGKIHVLRLESLGRRIGDIYAINTVGAIFGAFGAGFVLLPLLGTQHSIQVLAWINLAVGVALLALNPAARVRKKVSLAGIVALPVLLLVLFLPPDLFAELFQWSEPHSRLLFCDEDTGGTVTVHEFSDGSRLLKVNGGGEVPTDHASIQTFRLLGNLPLILHPHPQEVLVVAFGGGITLAAAEQHKPERLDCVEIVPGVFEAAAYFAQFNRYVYNRFSAPHVNVIVDDGRNHVLRTRRKYDVIISDATHPGTADSWVLYTEEFYRLCQQRLKQGGIIAQWLPLHGLSLEDYRMILRTFGAVYPHASLWLTQAYSIMLGTPEKLRLDLDKLQEALAHQGVSADLQEVDLGDPVSFLGTFILGEEELSGFVGEGPTNTDDHPRISFTDRFRQDTEAGLPVLAGLSAHLAETIHPYLAGADTLREQLDRRFAARNYTVRGHIAALRKDKRAAIKALKQALELDPGERGALRGLRELTFP